MHGLSARDGEREINWSLTSSDYERWRPDYPESFYKRLRAFGIGLESQTILDLGTGVGFWARAFARQGASVCGVDISPGQINEARHRATDEGLTVTFSVAPAEETGFATACFDVVTASQCWLYFDASRAIEEVKRLLKPGGHLVTGHFCWVPDHDPVIAATEALIKEHNPDWAGGDWDGQVPMVPSWSQDDFSLSGHFVYDEAIPFTRESWRGRIRASRGIGATLSSAQVETFDRALEARLETLVSREFTVRHRLDVHILTPRAAPPHG